MATIAAVGLAIVATVSSRVEIKPVMDALREAAILAGCPTPIVEVFISGPEAEIRVTCRDAGTPLQESPR